MDNATTAPLTPVREDRSVTDISAVRVPKTAEIVAKNVRDRIIRGQLKEGDFLPPERALMETLGISRPTLREAFRILEAEQFISIVRGSRTGARVHAPSVQGVARYASYTLQAQHTTMADIYQAQLAIEPFAVRQLALNHSENDIARLNDEVDHLKKLLQDGRNADFMIGLADFHVLLVRLADNNALLMLSEMLRQIAEVFQVRVLDNLLAERGSSSVSQDGINSFRKLIRLIEARNADAAEIHWQLHLRNASTAWLKGQKPGITITEAVS